MRKLTKSRPLFFARRLAADSPRARTAAPRRRGRPRGRESTMPRRRRPTEFCPAESGRMGIGREGGKEGEKREKRKKISGTAAAAAAAASAADGENDHQSYWLRQTEGAREALAAPGVAACSTEGRGDRRTGGHGGNRAVPRVGRSVRRCFAAALTYYSEGDADGETGAKQRKT